MLRLFFVVLFLASVDFRVAEAQPAKGAAYQLTDKETSVLRGMPGKTVHDVIRDKQIGKRLDEAFRAAAAGVNYQPGYSFYRLFKEQLTGPPEKAELIEERFLFAHGCMHHACPSKAAFMVDLQTGHLVMATHDDISRGWMVHKACINDELKAAALKRVQAWVAANMGLKSGEPPEAPQITARSCR